ncbi:rod shape-determining protein MreC, partial [Candidatus Pelagibacter sp.]|nr:rod shape-determining protein MreC [Candidatus Pelagibacter sp.]
GKIIEVNYTNSRALLLSDLNSKIPVLLEPLNIHAVLSGTGKNHGVIEFTKEEYDKKVNNSEIIIYTSGYGGLFKPGLPVGKIINNKNLKKNIVNFFSDFGQLDYVKIVSYEIGSGN